MAPRQRGQRRAGVLGLLAAALAALLAIVQELWEGFRHWLSTRNAEAQPQAGADGGSAAAGKKKKQKQKAAAAGPAAGKAAAARAQQPPSSDSESEEEEEQPRAPAATSGAFAAFATVEPGWEAVVPKSRKAKPAVAAAPAGGPKLRPAAAAAAGKKPAAAAAAAVEGSRGVCARPGCGLPVARGFAKCARCKQVYYCTPACMMSDFERHQQSCA